VKEDKKVICSNGHENQLEAKFCNVCGARLVESSIEPSQVSSSNADITKIQKSIKVRNLAGILLSIFLGALGGIFGILLGLKSLKEIKTSDNKLKGRGAAVASLILGIVSVVLTILIVVAVCASGSKSSSSLSTSSASSSYSITWTDTVYSTDCANSSFIGGTPVRVYGPNGQQVASGGMDSGADSTDTDKSGSTVNVCIYSATIPNIPSGLGSYTISDFGNSYANGLTFSETDISTDNAGSTRGY